MSETTSNVSNSPVIRAVISDLAQYLFSNLALISSESDVENIIIAYQTSIAEPDINLSSLSVDFEANNALLMNLFQNSGAWLDDSKSAVGTALVRALATMFTYGTYNVVRSAQESLLPYATLPSSIYAATEHLGIRIRRASSASMSASLTYTGTTFPLVLSPYTSFSINGVSYFNRAEILFQDNTSQTVTLYQGSINTITFTATGGNFQEYTFGNSDFAISDSDLILSVAGTEWTRAVFNTYFSTGLWNYMASDNVYVDKTTPDGNINIAFGNGTYGVTPALGSTISIQYCSTLGTSAAANYTGQTITCGASSLVSGVVTSSTTGGGDAMSAYDYKNLGPGLYASKGVGITSDGLNQVVRSYSGVADAIVLTQQDFAPSDITKMMQAQVVILPSTTWNADNYIDFYTWLQNSSIANMIYLNVDPSPITMNITGTIYGYTQSDLANIVTKAQAALINAFQIQNGILGYSRTVNDIYSIIKNSSSDIDYVDLSGLSDIAVTKTQYVVLGTVTLSTAYTGRAQLG